MLQRRENECEYEYGLRLLEYKIENNPQELEWEDVVEIFKLGIHRDSLRKSVQGYFGGYNVYKFMKNKLEEVMLDDSSYEIFSKLELEKLEIQKEKVKLRDQRRELNNLIRKNARQEYIKEEVINAIKESDSIIPIDFKIREYNSSEKEGVLILGDWHYGLVVENHWNKYNTTEFFNRINRLIEKTIEYGRHHNIKRLHVFGLGDFLHGLIHLGTRVSSEEDTVKQTKVVSETIGRLLIEFSREFKHVDYYMVTGNHARVTPNKKESIDEENFEEFIMWYLEVKLGSIPNITLHANEYDREIIVADILGYTCFGVHGDKDKLTNVAQNLALMLKKFPDYVFTADKHHVEENEIHGVEVVINRSLSGVDQYAKSIRKTSYAGQTFMIFDEFEGRECTYNIKLN